MGEDLEIREVVTLEEARATAELLDRIWGKSGIITAELFRALSTHGNPVLAAYRGGDMVGAQMGFLALDEGELTLHSHVTGVLPELQHAGLGFRLKLAQRDWCLARGIRAVTWTFDPMIARNAYFNLRKLGTTAVRFLPDFYGPMEDEFNVGERTDRIEVRWDLEDPGVRAAAEGRPTPGDPEGAEVLLDDQDGRPAIRETGDAPRLLVRIPSDYLALRETDRALAAAWRDAAAEALEGSLGRGYAGTDCSREGVYLLERR